MPDYHDPVPRARAATVALAAFIVAETGESAVAWTMPSESVTAATAALALLAVMIASVIAVGCWIYRVNANAHTFADGLSITPGWNVGWFFVPVANLWKPFEGVRETWQASHDPADWPFVPVPALLRVWWGSWLGGNVLSNVSFQVGRRIGQPDGLPVVDLAASVLLVVAAATLIRIVTLLSRAQPQARIAHAFA